VIQGSTKISVTVVATGRTYTAHVVGTAPSDDIAVIQIEGASGLKTINTATATVAIGDPVVATGNAGGRGGTPSAVAGSVVALGQTITATDENGANPEQLTNLIQIDAPIEAGDSGGPLANRAGEVVGMDSAAEVSGTRFRTTSTSGFAIPIAKALSVAQQIESGKASSTIHIGLPAFLGVQIAGTGGGRGVVPSSTGARRRRGAGHPGGHDRAGGRRHDHLRQRPDRGLGGAAHHAAPDRPPGRPGRHRLDRPVGRPADRPGDAHRRPRRLMHGTTG
jgi:S1-C subfamily serine protease